MKATVHSIAVSIIVIAVGCAWLLNTLEVLPGVNWIWTGGLGLAGLLILALGGLNKVTAVTGPFLILTSIFSVLRQTGRIDIDQEVPILVIALGLLMLVSQLLPLPQPGWLHEPGSKR